MAKQVKVEIPTIQEEIPSEKLNNKKIYRTVSIEVGKADEAEPTEEKGEEYKAYLRAMGFNV